jgi:hypothetical protein
MEPDFSGWATKANIKCTDGRTIMPDAFKHNDGIQVPLVWQHGHNSPENILGYGVLKHVSLPEPGTRIDAYFNSSKSGLNAKQLVEHGDIKHLSIYANNLVERNKQVMHGDIRETSLVLAGANRGAVIDNVNVRHGDGTVDELDDEVIVFTGLEFFHAEDTDGDGGTSGQGDDAPGDATDKPLQQIWDSLTPEQQDMVNYVVGEAVENAGNDDTDTSAGDSGTEAEHSNKTGEGDLSPQEGAEGNMNLKHNIFDQTGSTGATGTAVANPNLKHVDTLFTQEDKRALFELAKKPGMTLKSAFEETLQLKHGITPIDVLFPEYRSLDAVPQFNQRRMEWVQPFLNGLSHSPFSRVKSIVADITMDEARAKGYIKGTLKKEEWFSVSKRYTTPCTVYKKQQLDRDDIIDITDFDVVAWMKNEMSFMLKEEIARAILVGDGREVDDPDKIKDPGNTVSGDGLRSIVNENELYKTDVNINLTSTPNWEFVVEGVIRSMEFYKGTGSPTFFTTWATLTNMLLIKDTLGRRIYNGKADLATTMGVSDIIPVEVMETGPANLLGVIVNPSDYNVGADKGGEVNLFDFFDIDFNQYKYLGETRISGALTKVKSSMVIWTVPSADVLVTPAVPTFNYATGVATTVATTGVVYKDGNGNVLTAGAQTAIDPDTSITIVATPASGYYFSLSGNATAYWSFTRPNPDGANDNS